jgi:hypothetical protein
MRNLLMLGLVAAGASVCNAAPISRCEFSDGRVIYSDEPCPAGAQHMRTVDEKPAVEVIKAPRGQSAQSSGSVRRSENGQEAAGDADAASDLRKMKVAECDDLVRRVEYAQHDLTAASDRERASAELSLRRLQAEHENKCAPHR